MRENGNQIENTEDNTSRMVSMRVPKIITRINRFRNLLLKNVDKENKPYHIF